jgi:hypothetical protein
MQRPKSFCIKSHDAAPKEIVGTSPRPEVLNDRDQVSKNRHKNPINSLRECLETRRRDKKSQASLSNINRIMAI